VGDQLHPAGALKPMHRLLLLALALGVRAPVAALETTVQRLDGSPLTAAEVDTTVTRLMAAAEVPGVGIALFNLGKAVYLKTYGFRDKEKQLLLTPDSVMTAASLTKAVFATLVLQLVQDGVLDLDRPVYRYLPKPLPLYPSFRDLANDARYKQLTLRTLLSHTGGFPNWRSYTDDGKLTINFEPGSRYAYSGEGFLLAQLVVETVTKKSLNTVLRERLFGRAGMGRSSLVWEAPFETDFANGYDEWGRSLGPQRRTTADAAGSLQTTLRDYASFLEALMQDRLLDRQTRAQMLSPQVEIHSKHQFPTLSAETTTENRAIRLSYGLGWGLYWTPYGKAFFKEGHDVGWRHYAVCLDATGTGLLVMTNSANGEGMYQDLLETLLHNTSTPLTWEGFTPYSKLPPRPPLKAHHEVAVNGKLLESYVGRYAISADVVLQVSREGDGLFIQENDEPKQALGADDPRTFFSRVADDAYTFEVDAQGRATGVVLHTDGKSIPARRIP
jgi:CubicO group peptidase (beta-lactamase class C family)